MNGFVLIDKPATWTSTDVCNFLKRKLNKKKIGHAGTLDPFATGLLVLALGKYTKLLPYLESHQKVYETTILLNKNSRTLDIDSEIETEKGKDISFEEIKTVFSNFPEKYDQIPPDFSAKRINGKRAYALARAGEKIKLLPQKVQIFSREIIKFNTKEQSLRIKIAVSRGFYIRSFAHDFAKKLGTKGICSTLRRSDIGNISIKKAHLPQDNCILLEASDILDLEKFEIPETRINDFSHGRVFPCSEINIQQTEKDFLLTNQGKTIGVAKIEKGNVCPKIKLID